ncbi:amino acid adenylation domain-containing protein, partial [Kitasatospora sp. NPDC056651]|uniref:amino acid adenylation domain-containing protein n=1 Tax=Kitasatospora sp. NPDC056651 TaxID=3345892 RepID=UPI0036814B6D
MSFGQEQMWFLQRLDPSSTEYLVPAALRLRGSLDRDALERAWGEVLARHEVLRTRYVMEDVEPVQVVDAVSAPESGGAGLVLLDVSDVPEGVREERALELVRAACERPFDLEREWPVRAVSVCLGGADHVLLVLFHHIACDAWSNRVVLDELGALYGAFAAGRVSPLGEVGLQYADFAAWQREFMSGERLASELAYWGRRLAGLSALELPLDRARGPVRSALGAEVEVVLPPAVGARVREVAAALGVTPFVVVLGAFQVLLSRWAGCEDVAVGTVVSGRGRPELQSLVGYGINSVVIRHGWDARGSFAQLVEGLRPVVLESFDHQGVPFARLVDELEPQRDMARTPLYQVAFTMHEAGAAGERGLFGPGVTVEPFGVSGGVAKCDLELQVLEGADGSLTARLVYARELFERASIERMAGHFGRLLEGVLERPGVPLVRVGMLDEAERALVSGVAVEPGSGTRAVHELFEAQAAATPGSVAVTAGEVSLTYGELNERANRLAHHLRSLGVGAESLVGVCLERGADLIPTLLGVLKAGAGYVPLDPVNPADRLAYIAGDAAVDVVVAHGATLSLVAGFHQGATVVLDGADREGIAGREAGDPVSLTGPDNVIYVIYTSGSTGRPKGVTLTHGNVARLMSTAQEHYSFDESDVWSLFHSYAFDVSVFEMWGALLNGGRLVVVPTPTTRNPDGFLDLLVDEQVTVLSQTPTAFRSLVAAAADGDGRVDRLVLRAVVFAGEKLDVADLRPWVERVGLERPVLANMYGITETTVHTTFHRMSEADFAPGAGSRVGVALSDLTVRLLDAHGDLVPVGVPGEIHVSGPGLARAYLNRPGLTAQRFVPDPFGAPGERMYRSGDLARLLADGTLEVLGRIDDQVKIRGYRIELGEIQAELAALDDVREAVVIVREDTPGDKRLTAYYTTGDEGADLDLAQVREQLRQVLPDYMVPAAFVALDVLPLTANGKLDKRALPAPGQESFAHTAYVAPRSPDEEQIAGVWTRVLGVERVGVHDSFFDLGGDSIRAVGLVGALRSAGFPATVRDVFAARTVAGLAAVTGQAQPQSVATVGVAPFALIGDDDRAKLPAGVVDAYPLSQIQTGMVVEMLADTGRNLYHNVSTYRIRDTDSFSPEAFTQAAAILVERHEALRTSIHLTGYGRPMQLVHAAAEPAVGVTHLTGLDEAGTRERLEAFTTAERATLFDLGAPPLMRYHAHTSDTDPGGWWISVTECHPVMEGWSYHTLLMELLTTYRHLRHGRTPEVPTPAEVRYADFIAAELDALASPEHAAYWQRVVDDRTPFSLPAGLHQAGADPRRPVRTHQVGVPWHDLEDGLRALARSAGASLKSVMIAAHTKVMSQLTDQRSFHLGLVCDARPEATGADRVPGMYLNTLPFPVDPITGTWHDLVQRTFAQEIELWPHRHFPMPAIQRQTGTGRLINTSFNYQDFRQVDHDLIDAHGGIDDSPTEHTLTVSCRAGYVILTHTTPALAPEHAQRIADMYRAVLEAMAHHPHHPAHTTHLPAGEREFILGSGLAAVEPVDSCVHELFEAQASATPGAVAVTAGEVSLTYAELNERANRLAHHLRTLGVGAESLVGVCLERGADLIPTLLGVLKAGAGYVPLDPANPADRLDYIAADAAVEVVVAHEATLPLVTGFHSGATVVLDGADRSTIAASSAADPAVVSSPENVIYVIYTSGSTGRPKGVALTHANVARLMSTAQEHYAFDGSDVWTLFHSYAFDFSVWEIWGPLLHGGRLVVVPSQATRDPEEFLDLLADEQVTVLNQTPTAFRTLTAAARDGDPRIGRLALRVVVFGGEKLDMADLQPWVERLGLERPVLVNMYGITETTVHNTYHRLIDADFTAGAGSRIGTALADLTVRVLNPDGRLVPVGVPGEIHVCGPGLARGYANRPGLTAQRFIPDPYGMPGARMYRTGDLARLLTDGTLEVLGRIDDQVKIRGFRIELGEIQAALAAVDGIREAVVIVREDTPGDKRLTAYYTLAAEGIDLDLPLVRAELGRVLPEYMVPAAFVVLDRVPVTLNGKLDRRALPAPDQDAYAHAAYIAPRTEAQERIAEIWAEVLDAERVGVEDSFFDLGGDSIRAIALVGALRNAGFPASIQQVFQQRTVANLATALADQQAPAPVAQVGVAPFALIGDEDRAALPADVVDAYPLSQVQAGMVVETLVEAGRVAYHGFVAHRVRDERPFSAEALRRAVDLVASRHEVLRTSVHLGGYSQPLQLVHAEVSVPVDVHDLRGLGESERARALTEFLAADSARPFDPETAPLLRVSAHLEGEEGWRLAVSQHHAVTEGWSYHSLIMELVRTYLALRDGDAPDAPEPVAVRYADFVAAELDALASPVHRGYWRRVVDEYTPLVLPEGWQGPADEEAERYNLRVTVDDLQDGLRALARSAGASLKSVMIAAHTKVMSQLTEQSTFHAGVVYDVRMEAAGGDRVLGMYLNTLPFPVDPMTGTWRDLVRRTFEREVELSGHRRFPLPEIQRMAGTGRLLDIVFNYQDFHQIDTGIVDKNAGFGTGSTEFGLGVIVSPSSVSLQASSHTLAPEHARRIADMYRAVLEAMAHHPHHPAHTTHLPAKEEELVLSEWMGEVREASAGTLMELFEAQVAARPDAIAVTFEGTHATYAELDERANRLAHHLRTLGVGAESPVGVCLDRSVELVVAVVAVGKAGGAFVPMDPEYSQARMAMVLEDSGASTLLTQRHLLSALPACEARLLLVDEPAAWAEYPATAPARFVTPDSPAYVIFTSGSTGRPKGAANSHRGILNSLAALNEYAELGPDDTVLVKTSIGFDPFVWEVFGTLTAGARMLVSMPGGHRDPVYLSRLMADGGVTAAVFVPSMLSLVLEHGDLRACRTLRAMVCGGEDLPVSLVEGVHAVVPGLLVLNAYGPTEAAFTASVQSLRDPLPESMRQRIAMGRPIRNTSLYVLDANLRPQAVGVPGELFIAGVNVGRGYANRPGLTAQCFIPDPYGMPGARMYRTGDLARWREDGTLEFLGRIDDQVKIRGFRIELGEIQAALAAVDGVREVVVIVREDTPGDKRLTAYYTLAAEGIDLDLPLVRAELGRVLPEYMVPAAFVVLDRVPVTLNGKLDRRALPAPDQDAYAHAAYIAPRTEAQERIAEIWAEVLDAERVGVEDSFFDLGGDSIRAIALVGALRNAGFPASIQQVFQQRTVANLATALADQQAPAPVAQVGVAPFALIGDEDRAALPADVVDAYPLSQVQTGMIAEGLTAASGNAYHMVSTARVQDERPFDHQALTRAWQLLTRRHETLRTSIHLAGHSQPLQLVHAGADTVIGLRDVPHTDLAEALRAYVGAEREHPLDLDRAPLFRLHVTTTTDTPDAGWWLSMTSPHAVIDGWSQETLRAELLDCYQHLCDGNEPPATEAATPDPAAVVRYADFIAAELDALASPADRVFWHDVVTTHTPVTLPPHWADTTQAPHHYSLRVPIGDLTGALTILATTSGVPLKTILLAAHTAVMGTLAPDSAYHTGLVTHARPETIGADRVIGMHLNTLPFPADHTATTWRDLIQHTFTRELDLWAHRHHPLPAIQRLAGTGRLLNTFFNYTDFHQAHQALDQNLSFNDSPKEFGLTIDATPTHLTLSTNTHHLTPTHARHLADTYRATLETLATNPDTPIRTPDDIAATTTPEPLTAHDADMADGIHALFEAQAAATPGAVAVTAGEVSLTYGELNERANRLAHHLRSLGVGAESLVGVCLERGADLIPTLLGVLKAGAGYVPLDPVNPADRLAYIAGDAAVDVVVAHGATLSLVAGFHQGVTVVLDGADREGIAGREAGDPVSLTGPDNVIYVIYTSGSTGRPKGVTLTHGNVARLMSTAQEHYSFDESDVWSLFHSYAFDVSVFEMWGALLNGGRLVVVPTPTTRNPDGFLDLLVDEQVTVLSQTPTAFRSLVTAAADNDRRIKQLSLRAVVFAGEKLDIPELQPWTTRLSLGRCALVNMYGITETTVHTTYHRLTKRDFTPGAGNAIGRPLGDLAIHLLDPHGNPVPTGAPGEIHVTGPGLARNYLNRPALTAQRFIPDPHGTPGTRMYRSGDLARQLPDGTYEFLGRIDDQVKIRGFRIELGEIQSALSALEGVREAVVLAREDVPGDKYLVAYYTATETGAGLDLSLIREQLGRALPEYMVPAAFVALDRLPLTPNGKLDKHALPVPGQDAYARTVYVAPRTPVEERIAAIWERILGAEQVGVHDSFFDLGGDSIRAVALVGALRTVGYPATMQDIFACRSVAALAEKLTDRKAEAPAGPGVPPFALIGDEDRARLPDDVVDAYPLTQAQLGMVVEMLSTEGALRYHNVASLRVRGEELSVDALRRAVALLAGRHEVLRTSVDLESYDTPLQLVHAAAEIPVGEADLRGLDAQEQERRLRVFVAEESRTAFDLAQAPLLRLFVHRLDADSWQFTVTQAHVILDGWSYHALLGEIITCYRELRDGSAPQPWQAPRVRFADAVAEEVAALASVEDRSYWRGIVDGWAKFDLPTGWGEPTGTERDPYSVEVTFEDLEPALAALAAESGTSVKSVLHAAHLRVVGALTRESCFFTGLTCHTRPEAEGTERVQGMFLNILPFAMDRSARTWRELVRQVFDRETELWPHRSFPMSVIQRELAQVPRLIDVHFSYQDFGRDARVAEGARVGGSVDAAASLGASDNEFALFVVAGPGRLTINTRASAVQRTNGDRLAGLYRAVLEAMVADPDAVMDATSLVSREDSALLTSWNATARPGSGNVSVPELIERQTTLTPDTIAVVADGT